ncbi:hypothetical protein BDW74DRAFT_188455 [Aspergillus multicolor]|uniref:uncharacterized protein n=1 Tax=Aspergillus multicolor TaxID=41759 RepID=UPI003CCDFF32
MPGLEFDGLPQLTDSAFQRALIIPRPPSRRTKQHETRRNPQNRTNEPRRHAPYVSFGDGTITATSGAFGSVLRISQYVEQAGLTSNMVALDDPLAPLPYCMVARADDLFNRAQLPGEGFGMRLERINGDHPLEDSTPPSLTFLGDKWPRIEYTINNALDFKVDLVCQNHMVVQRMRVTNNSLLRQVLNLEFNPSFVLRDLDYTSSELKLSSEYSHGPHGHSLVFTPKILPTESRPPFYVVVGLFKNRVAQELKDDSKQQMRHDMSSRSIVEYLTVFKIRCRDTSKRWEKYIVSVDEVNRLFQATPGQTTNWEWPLVEQAHVRWSLRRNLEHILGVCSIHISPDHSHPGSEAFLNSVVNNVAPATPGVAEGNADHRATDYSASGIPMSEVINEGPRIILNTPDGERYSLQETESHKFELRKVEESRKNRARSAIMEVSNPAEKASSLSVISLTCGDISDHRVCISGSYFAFMFMLNMHQQAELYKEQDVRGSEYDQAQDSQRRIHETCRGHLEWVSRLERRDALSSNIWAGGRSIANTPDASLPHDSPTNLPYQILKATAYLRKWVEHLRLTRNRLSPTWEHLQDLSDIPVYRLSDHAWIWKALHDIEELVRRVQEEKEKIQQDTETLQQHMSLRASESPSTGILDKFLRAVAALFPTLGRRRPLSAQALNFTVEDMRKQNIRRFTLENDVLKKRMLSVTRTARETRFLFHSRDTVLYYGRTWGFITKDQSDLFEQLVKAQIQHDEEGIDEALWDNPLRYALALLMAHSNHQLDRDIEPKDMISHAMAIIQNSSSENGLYPGNLDPSTKEPELFNRELYRDFYFHCGFEIPYILLLVFSTSSQESPPERLSMDDSSVDGSSNEQDRTLSKKRSTELPKVIEKAIITETGDNAVHAERVAVLVQRSLKRQNPHGRLVDLSNIVDVPEEWLYKYPDFLGFEPPKLKEAESIIRDGRLLLGNEKSDPGTIAKAMENGDDSEDRYAFVEDVRKSGKQHKRGGLPKTTKFEARTFKNLWDCLEKPRHALQAKKRFIYLRSIDPVRAMICCIASPESERLNLAQFFDRQGKSKPYIYDDTTVALNLWVTEVFFQFFHKGEDGQKAPGQVAAVFGKLKPSGRSICLTGTFTGFRIVGDFFDRYWTCHYIDNEIGNGIDDHTRFVYNETDDWQQRKVLELIILSRILQKVCTSTEEILREVESKPSPKHESGYEDAYDNLEDRSPENLRECERVLLLLKKNLISLREVIDQWNVRESSQGRERPRWTRRDEQKYRKPIKQRRAALEGHVRDVRAKEIHIEFLLGRVTSAQEAIRSKKSLKQAENITLFTYATMFFLPAGLAVSIFSMNGIPSHTVVGWMILTAAVALVITASLLYGVIYHFHLLRKLWDLVVAISSKSKSTFRRLPEALRGADVGTSNKLSLKKALLPWTRLDDRDAQEDAAHKHV